MSTLRHLLLALILFGCCNHRAATAFQINFGLPEGYLTNLVGEGAWKGQFGSGLNGKSGNSESLDINMTLKMDRETDVASTNVQASYFYGSNAVATVTDRLFTQLRQERKLAKEGWAWYVQAALEWDRFKAFDYRVALHSGLSYQFYKDDTGFLKARMGAGASKEVGSVNDEWSPELQFGGDWERKLTDTTTVFATVDYFPNVSDFADFRVNTNVGCNFLVDAPRNINFRVFALTRFDSTPPPGTEKSDIVYGMALVFGF